jgi:hypothetical protein
MPWLVTGVFERENGLDPQFKGKEVWQDDLTAGIKIIASRHDYHDQDIADGVAACLNLDGYNAMRANLDMGGFKFVNAADGTLVTDPATVGQTAGSMTFDDGLRTLELFDKNAASIDTVVIPSGSGGGGEGSVSSIGPDGQTNPLEFSPSPITTTGTIGLPVLATGQTYSGGIAGVVIDDNGRVTQVTTGGFANTNLSLGVTQTTVTVKSSTGTDATINPATSLQAGVMTKDQAVIVADAMRLSGDQTASDIKTFNEIVVGTGGLTVSFGGTLLSGSVLMSTLPFSDPSNPGQLYQDGGFVKIS